MGLIESLAPLLAPVLNLPPIRRTRRNHGLELATHHVITQDPARANRRRSVSTAST
jgi:hypothetical protein